MDEIPHVKSGCGILGIMRRPGSEKVHASETLTSIECVRYRGSRLGAGFAVYDLERAGSPLKLKAFVDSDETVEKISEALHGMDILVEPLGFDSKPMNGFTSWTAYIESSPDNVRRAVNSVNHHLLRDGFKGRIYSWGRFLEVFKAVGYPSDVYGLYGLDEGDVCGDLWLAHTRQPTNSPGVYPIWSHPFASYEVSIVHNGDVSSFGANMEFLRYRGFESFVGTDSEVAAYTLDYLTSVEGVSLVEAASLMAGLYDDIDVAKAVKYRGVCLDGPYSILAGYCDGEDLYLLAVADTMKFRPLVVGYDDERIYAASEEAEIRSLSEKARVWPVKPGGIFLASLKRGIILSGREHVECFYGPYCRHPTPSNAIDATGMSYSMVNALLRKLFQEGVREVALKNVNGHRYLGINMPPDSRLHIYGTAGNCLANFNKHGEIYVYGNAQDDVGDAMYGGRVVIHGDARDVVGQALQGGAIFVRGSVGNRAAIQMREFRDRRPCLVVGGRADDFLGEYMAGGVVMVLGVDALDVEDVRLAGQYVASGMVGGRIYIRGYLEPWRIGLNPPAADIIQYLRGLALEGLVGWDTVEELSNMIHIMYEDLAGLLPGKALKRISKLYRNKYYRELRVNYRNLDYEDLRLVGPILSEFFSQFHLDSRLQQELISRKFTVVEPVGAGPVLEKPEE
ncbi:Glutamate synthase [NADPH] large chain [archaeon HR01]|nr:Glutamate synthase [NADPH] large chain [archaeon HR01]